jgi:CBS domain-containing membrane protein
LARFRLLLAGATVPDRLIACLGAFLGVVLIAALSGVAGMTLLLAPIGASAVLVFAVPASPLAQPWPIIGGNSLSALIGLSTALLIPSPSAAAAVAVPLAILAMSLGRCLHPPGGAVALLAATTGAALPLPVLLGSLLLAGTGIAFHRFTGHAYPHRPDPALAQRELAAGGLVPGDLDRALADLHETFDISREDLALLLARAEHHAAKRRERAAA